MILVDLIILALIGYGAYKGAQRGVVLVALEFSSFIIATLVALALYSPAGQALEALAAISLSLANVSAFVIIWTFTEVICGLTVRYLVLPRLRNKLPPSRLTQIGGAVLNGLKITILIIVGLALFAGLSLKGTVKQPVTTALTAQLLLTMGQSLQQWLEHNLGADINQAFNIFTVAPITDNDKKIDLDFTVIDVKPHPEAEKTLFALTNRERTSRGLAPLTVNEPARRVARAYSARMLAEGYFSHTDSDGRSPFDRLKAGGVKFRAAGENLALAPTPQLAHQGLMDSPGHRANILSRDYHKVGIGVIDAGPHGLMVTQAFTD